MIRNSELDVVKNLFDNIKSQADDHPKFEMLETLYKERVGE